MDRRALGEWGEELTAAYLRRRGYTEAQIEKIAWKNYWRVLKQAEKQRA